MAQHWAKAPIERNQIVLFSPTLEDALSHDHPVRLLDEILRGLDWSEWMQTPEGRTTYKHRMHGAETPFAHIKQVMGVRQFLLRGLEHVPTEWCWVCTAFNFKKLLKYVAAPRAELSRMTAEVVIE